jgi:UDPglucose--hexose-1-phosphate uridylyltransferase
MPEIRNDPVRGHSVIVAEEREGRPREFMRTDAPGDPAVCPFCPGREDRTPPESDAVGPPGRRPDTPGWTARVVPNKFPVVGGTRRPAPGAEPAPGVHEVLVETADHHARRVGAGGLAMVRARLRRLRGTPAGRYRIAFKNRGDRAGATLSHPHVHILGMGAIPPRVLAELDRLRAVREREGCLDCRAAGESGERTLFRRDGLVALAPFAARVPYETWILPVRHTPRFEETPDADLESLAGSMTTLLDRFDALFDTPPGNWILHTAPDHEAGDAYHWRMELFPKLGHTGGFEWGTGMTVNIVSPETAVRRLRGAGEA